MVRVLVLTLLLAAATLAKDIKCPNFPGKTPFDETKFAGTWYGIGGIPPKNYNEYIEKSCLKFTITPGESFTRTYHMTYKADGKSHAKDVFSQACKAEKASTSWAVYRKDEKDGVTTYSAPHKQTIVATDYEKYALLVGCKPMFNETTKSFSSAIMASIISRTPTLKTEYLSVLKNLLSGFDFDMNDYKIMDHTNCQEPAKHKH